MSPILGNIVLYPKMVMEKLGGREGVSPEDGSKSRNHIRRGKKVKKETPN